jgi:hypothetical protein
MKERMILSHQTRFIFSNHYVMRTACVLDAVKDDDERSDLELEEALDSVF